MADNLANPRDFIYLLAQVVFRPNVTHEYPMNLTWTFSTAPVYPPESSTSGIRVNKTSEELFKIDKNKLEDQKTYWFRAAGKVTYLNLAIYILIKCAYL